jgi:hypothetical protein
MEKKTLIQNSQKIATTGVEEMMRHWPVLRMVERMKEMGGTSPWRAMKEARIAALWPEKT